MSKEQSGDPRKQDRPDGREPGAEVTKQYPPSVTGVITEFGVTVIPFPFRGSKGLRLEANCGPLQLHLMLEPAFADTVCEAIQTAASEARSDLRVAGISDIKALNGAKA